MTEDAANVDALLIERIGARSSATLYEAAKKTGALPALLKPHAIDVRVCGMAFPVRSPSGDNLWLHHAIYAASPGDVLVIDVGSDPEFGYWGEVMAVAAQCRGIAGIVINGGVRDIEKMLAMRFPVFSLTPCIKGTLKSAEGKGHLGQPITLGEITIERGDIVLADCDGIVVLPSALAREVLAVGEARDAEEERIFQRLRAGESTLDIYGLPVPRTLEARP